MAHPVKCTICGEVFDRDRVECVNTATRRYAHKSCYNKEQGTLAPVVGTFGMTLASLVIQDCIKQD